jgi:membrane associated rhomboid family serine protease
MLFPYGTNAPIYHWPKATVGLIVATLFAYFWVGGLFGAQRLGYGLDFGRGLHPLQWLTSLFMHTSVIHLVGNMIFLWIFGILIEGKLGPVKFVPLYLLLGVAQAALAQWFFQGSEYRSGKTMYGAAAAIYGLEGLCLAWAPKSKLTTVVFAGSKTVQFDIPLIAFALVYPLVQLSFILYGFVTTTGAGLQLLALPMGFILGLMLVVTGLVDTENWDIVSVLVGRDRRSMKELRTRSSVGAAPAAGPAAVAAGPSPAAPEAPKGGAADEALAPDPVAAAAAITDEVRRHLKAGDPKAAYAVYHKAIHGDSVWQPEGKVWLDLIQALIEARDWKPAVLTMDDYLRRAPDPSHRVRLKLAQVLLREHARPAHALRVLREIPPGKLSRSLEPIRDQLISQAEAMQKQGVAEVEGDAW